MDRPLSRGEALLADIRDGTSLGPDEPRSRVERLLMEIRDGGSGGGGGGPTLVAGDNVTLAADATDGTVTISATDTTYGNATAQAAGLMSAAHFSKVEATPAFVACTQADYDAMDAHDAGTWYAIVEAS